MQKNQNQQRYSDFLVKWLSNDKNINVEKILNQQITLLKEPDIPDIGTIFSAINSIFYAFVTECNLSIPHIPIWRDADFSLSLQEKQIIQTKLREHSHESTGNQFQDFSDLDMNNIHACSCCLYLYEAFIKDDNETRRNKILYAFTYLMDNNLSSFEIKCLDTLLHQFNQDIYLSAQLIHLFEMEQAKKELEEKKQEYLIKQDTNSYLECEIIIDIIFNDIKNIKESIDIPQEVLEQCTILYEKIDNTFSKSSEKNRNNLKAQHGWSSLFDKLIDISYTDITFSYVNILYEDSIADTQTYNQFISNYQKDLNIPSVSKKVLNNIFCETIKKHLTRKIYVYDYREEFYRNTRGYKNINNRTSIPYCRKYIMELIFLGTKLQKSNYTEKQYEETEKNNGIPYEYFHKYYKNINNIAKQTLFPHLKETITDDDFEKFQTGFKYYLEYFNLGKKHPKSQALQPRLENIFFFITNIKKYFSYHNETETNWFNYNSLFVTKWDFITYSSYIYSSRIKEEALQQSDLSNEEYISEFIDYCHDISKLPYPHLLKELLDEPSFFKAYLHSKEWFSPLTNLLYGVEQITAYVIPRLYSLPEDTHSSSKEELEKLYNILKYYNYDSSLEPPITETFLSELTEFMSLYLPPDNKKA